MEADLKKKVEKFVNENPGVVKDAGELFVTCDGNIFTEKHYADSHAQKNEVGKQSVYVYEVSKPKKKKKTTKKTKE